MQRKLLAEFFGTFWLVFGGVGSALFAAGFAGFGIGFLGVALSFGLTVTAMAYAVGHISGGHFNPAVTAGVVIAGRMPVMEAIFYVIAQLIGATVSAAILYFIVSNQAGFSGAGGFASNGFGDLHSPGHYSMAAGFLAETIVTAFFLLVILGSTSRDAPAGFAPIAIGLMLTVAHLILIPLTNASVNPARSTATALFAEPWALEQLWMFWAAPILGGVLGGLIHRGFLAHQHCSRA